MPVYFLQKVTLHFIINIISIVKKLRAFNVRSFFTGGILMNIKYPSEISQDAMSKVYRELKVQYGRVPPVSRILYSPRHTKKENGSSLR